jgi:hypothetical protein
MRFIGTPRGWFVGIDKWWQQKIAIELRKIKYANKDQTQKIRPRRSDPESGQARSDQHGSGHTRSDLNESRPKNTDATL